MQPSVKERLIEFLKYKNLSQIKFAKIIGVSNGYVNSMRKSIQPDKLNSIAAQFPDLNVTWLLTGEGEMLKKDAKEEEQTEVVENSYLIPLLPVCAKAGVLTGVADQVDIRHCELIRSPIEGMDYAITVHGDSMEPEYCNGCIIIIKRINERIFIEWGRCYVLDTENGSVFKKLMPCKDDPEKVTCVSINPDYPPFDVSLSDIYGIYRVHMMMDRK